MSLYVKGSPPTSSLTGGGGGGGGSGTVTSVALADGSSSPIYTISGSPVTTSGTLAFTLSTKAANLVFAGPTTGSAAQPTFRALVAADIPTVGIAAGSNTQIQFNNSGAFGASANLIWDGTNFVTTNAAVSALMDPSLVVIMDMSAHVINDATATLSLDYNNRQLYANDGLTVVFDWSSSSGLIIPTIVQSYNGDTLAGNGLASIVGSVQIYNSTTPVTTTTLFTGGNGPGIFQLNAYLYPSSVGSGGSSMLTVTWDDGTSTKTIATSNVLLNSSSSFQQITTTIFLNAGTNMTYACTCNSPAGGAAYALYISLNRLS